VLSRNLKAVKEVYGEVLLELEDGEEVTLAKEMLQIEPHRIAPKRAAKVIMAGPPSNPELISHLQDQCRQEVG
jgi:hypothetical protein